MQLGAIFKMHRRDAGGAPLGMAADVSAEVGIPGLGALVEVLHGEFSGAVTPAVLRDRELARSADLPVAPVEAYERAWSALKRLGYLQERLVEHGGQTYQFLSVTEVKGWFAVDLDQVSDEELLPRLGT